MPRKIKPIRIEGNIAYVPLTKGYEAVIDASDIDAVKHVSWYANVYHGGAVYACARISVSGNKITLRMHRVVMGDPVGFEVDHKDGNGLHNWKDNLRVATSSENKCNRRISSLSKTGLKGVGLDKRDGRYYARIKKAGKQVFLGRFATAGAAHEAYAAAVEEYHGEFARVA
ncbi:MAG: HNH endonuclease [Beijerinckiaceae bacterium]